MKKLALTSASTAIAIVIALLCLAAGAKLFDLWVGRMPAPQGSEMWNRNIPILDFELFPYTGFHMQAFTHMNSDGSPGKSYDIDSGAMGFWAPEFDVLRPPKKEPAEFRIIIIGGSGAQGQGAFTNDQLWHRQLQDRLNKSAKAGRYRVINLSMGGANTYQNYIALNQFGHALEPDLIISYSGFNDWAIPYKIEELPEVFYNFRNLIPLVYATRSDWPDGLRAGSTSICRTSRAATGRRSRWPSPTMISWRKAARSTFTTEGSIATSLRTRSACSRATPGRSM